MKNIAIGIDLGTTNSEIAVFFDGRVEVLKNTLGDEYTPSVFGINRGGQEEVGKKPYTRYFKEANTEEVENNKPEIKRLMGQSEKTYFPRNKQSYLPEEISSKILLNLKQNVARKSDKINTQAAVITIPAHFDTTQCEATKRAGNLAGFEHVILLQEPIAAAISYGFSSDKNETWLVYDLGGGTFDVALIALNDGNLSVLGHSGDNFLGGKDIDNLIVDKKIVPLINQKYKINLDRSENEFKVVFARLKYAAEQAKIALSSSNETSIEVEFDFKDKSVYENITLKSDELEDILKPLIDKTISHAQKTINEAQISKVDKIILVGGPTQLPFIKKRLENELKIPVDTSTDPLTAIAKGACIYAMSQKIPANLQKNKTAVDKSAYEIELNYESLSSNDDELVTGVIDKLKDSTEEYFIRIQNANNTYNSGDIKLKNGKFSVNLVIEPKSVNTFKITLSNKDGQELKLNQSEFSITHGISISGTPIPHSIGVGVSKEDYITGEFKQEYEIFFPKNSILPLEKTKTFKAARTIKKGDTANALPITIYEGEFPVPDRNIEICDLSISGEKIKYTIGEGEDIEITIKVNESREVFVEAFIPQSNETFNARATTFAKDVSSMDLSSDLLGEKSRVQKLDELLSPREKNELSAKFEEVDKSIKNSTNSNDEKAKAQNGLKAIRAKLDEIETNKDIEVVKIKHKEILSDVEYNLTKIKNEQKKTEFTLHLKELKRDADKAITQDNSILLKKVVDQLQDLNAHVLMENDEFWIDMFENLSIIPPNAFNDAQSARRLLSSGEDAINAYDYDKLRKICISLLQMLPRNQQSNIAAAGKIAGIKL